MGISVCTKTCEDSLLYHSHGWRTSACITHVRFRIMYDHGICVFDQIHLMFIYIDAVTEQSLRSKDVPVMKAVNDTFSMLFQTLMEIINAFCYMDVISNTFRFQLIAESHCLIRDCKGCMHTHHSGDHITVVCKCMFNKIHVLHYRFSGFLHSVTIRNLIAEAGTHT